MAAIITYPSLNEVALLKLLDQVRWRANDHDCRGHTGTFHRFLWALLQLCIHCRGLSPSHLFRREALLCGLDE